MVDFNEQDGPIEGLDPKISQIVKVLRENGIETCQSCQGGPGHSSHKPYVDFRGYAADGPLAVGIAMMCGMPVASLSRKWSVIYNELTGPIWRMTFVSSKLDAFVGKVKQGVED